jgi:ribosome-associated heat shock protein Hsp15
MDLDRQRIDKWLWHARVVRTRTAAAGLVEAGHVRLNGSRVAATSHAVKAGDVVTVALDRSVRVMKVTGFVERRGPAEVAQATFEEAGGSRDPGPTAETKAAPARDPGAGRPTKQERRAVDRLHRRDGP